MYGVDANDASVDQQPQVAQALAEVAQKLDQLRAQPGPVAPAPMPVPAPARPGAAVVPGARLTTTPRPRPAVPAVASPTGLRTVGGGGLTQFPPLRR